MASSAREDRWKDLDVTTDEIDKIGKALKDEKFRKMFVEYAEEIADPKNRELYEQEIAQMEAERGMDVQFIHPNPGHVLKAQSKSPGSTDSAKIFVNICQNEFIGEPSNEKKVQPNGKVGLQWSIPHSFSPAREDIDKKGNKCAVYDVVFHPDTYKMSSNSSFLKLLHDTALEGLERQFGLTIDRTTVVKFQQLKFKGRPEPTITRKKKADAGASANSNPNKENDPLAKFPYPYENGVTSEELAQRKAKEVDEQKKRKQSREGAKKNGEQATEVNTKDGVTVPHYTITNQYGIDMSDYSQSLSGTPMPTSNTPSAIVIAIHLPKLKSAAPCQLDVTERSLSLESDEPAVYKLAVRLPYPVDDENGAAKFDKTKKQLVVTLPVNRKKVMQGIKDIMLESSTSNQDEIVDSEVNPKPLIEELEPTATVTDDQTSGETKQEMAEPNQVEETSDDKLSKLTLDNKILYKVSPFSFDQEEDSVTLVLNVASINRENFHAAYHENTVEVIFSTISRSGFPTHYSLKCIFPSAVVKITKDLAESDAVVTISKQWRGFWEGFESVADNSSDEMQINKFITKADLEQEAETFENSEPVELSPKTNLTIDVKTNKSETEALISPEVVHQNGAPTNIQGILKRTMSESSADDLQNSNSDGSALTISSSSNSMSPTDLPSPRERKKSVSFNDKVEETMFKSKDSVCQMHKTLLNRRKKQRQRQNRKEENLERRRRNSSTENNSSSEENSKKKDRRRRHSSSTSDDGNISPRTSATCLEADTTHEHGDSAEMCTCPQSDSPNEQQSDLPATDAASAASIDEKTDDLNSDDDEDGQSDIKSESQSGGVTNWSETSDFVEKTQCAFDFQNNVIFDLDE